MTLNHYLKKDFPFNEEPLFLRFRFLYSDQRSILLFYQILIFIFSSVEYFIGHMGPRLGSVSISVNTATKTKPQLDHLTTLFTYV